MIIIKKHIISGLRATSSMFMQLLQYLSAERSTQEMKKAIIRVGRESVWEISMMSFKTMTTTQGIKWNVLQQECTDLAC
jgi:hypothetical protein